MRAPGDYAKTQPGAYSAFYDPNAEQSANFGGFAGMSPVPSGNQLGSSAGFGPGSVGQPTFSGFNGIQMYQPGGDGLGGFSSPYQQPNFGGLIKRVNGKLSPNNPYASSPSSAANDWAMQQTFG